MWMIGVSVAIAGDDLAEARQVQDEVRKYISAHMNGDIATIIGLTHVSEVEMQGGSDSFELQQRNMAGMLRAAQSRIEQIRFPSRPQFFEGKDGRRFVIVPTVVTSTGVNVKGRVLRFVSEDFTLGILDPEAGGWRYMDGHLGGKGVTGVQARFSDFPSGVTLPPRTMMKFGG